MTHLRSRLAAANCEDVVVRVLELHRDAFEITTQNPGLDGQALGQLELHRDAFEITTGCNTPSTRPPSSLELHRDAFEITTGSAL